MQTIRVWGQFCPRSRLVSVVPLRMPVGVCGRQSEIWKTIAPLKLECLALKWAVCDKFREYLLGNNFVVYTDNNPLCHLQTSKLGALEQRWLSQLASFNFVIKYRPGRVNQNADALSRQAMNNVLPGTELPQVLQQQLRERSLERVVVSASEVCCIAWTFTGRSLLAAEGRPNYWPCYKGLECRQCFTFLRVDW